MATHQCICIDIVSAYRRQKLKEESNLSACYAAYLLENVANLSDLQQLPDDPRLPEIRRLRPYDSPPCKGGTSSTVSQCATPSLTPKHTVNVGENGSGGVDGGVSNSRQVVINKQLQNGVRGQMTEV